MELPLLVSFVYVAIACLLGWAHARTLIPNAVRGRPTIRRLLATYVGLAGALPFLASVAWVASSLDALFVLPPALIAVQSTVGAVRVTVDNKLKDRVAASVENDSVIIAQVAFMIEAQRRGRYSANPIESYIAHLRRAGVPTRTVNHVRKKIVRQATEGEALLSAALIVTDCVARDLIDWVDTALSDLRSTDAEAFRRLASHPHSFAEYIVERFEGP